MGERSRLAQLESLDVAKVQSEFEAWLKTQPLAKRTAEAYRAQVTIHTQIDTNEGPTFLASMRGPAQETGYYPARRLVDPAWTGTDR